jgi:hypothetical protein
MDQYKKIEVREINGFKVVSRTLNLSEEEEQKKLSEIIAFLTRIAVKNKNDNSRK